VAAAAHQLVRIEVEAPRDDQRQEAQEDDDVGARVRGDQQPPALERQTAGQRVESHRQRAGQRDGHGGHQVERLEQWQARQVERRVALQNRFGDPERRGVPVQRHEAVEIGEAVRRDGGDEERHQHGDPAEESSRHLLRDLEITEAPGESHRADGAIDGKCLGGVPRGRDRQRDELPAQGAHQERPVTVREALVGEPGVLGIPERHPSAPEEQDENAHDGEARNTAPVHG
jgi:hypothetical protein